MPSYRKNLSLVPLLQLLPCLLLASAASAATYFVDSRSEAGNSTGESWRSAFASLQQAIEAASANGGGEIWVKAGVYTPEGQTRDTSFILHPNIALYGGFRGNESNREQRNPKANRTVLSGDAGRIGSPSDNSYHVVVAHSGGIIDGFIISRGNADAVDEDRHGGGVLLPPDSSNVVIANCTFEKNNADTGGAIHLNQAQAFITNCTFYANSADVGGAISTGGKAELGIVDSVFSSNFALNNGGAIALASLANTTLLRCNFLYNSSNGNGGAIHAATEKVSPLLFDAQACRFNENSARNGGGAAAFSGPFLPRMAECTFEENVSTRGAGAVSAGDGAKAIVLDATYVRNKGPKGRENTEADSFSKIVESTDAANQIAKNPSFGGTGRQIKPAPSKPKPKPMLPDVFVYNMDGNKVKLRSIVADTPYTVLAFGDLTDSDFIEHYRNIEAIARDYAQKKVGFSYIYRHLQHPENNGYVQPYLLKERARQTQIAKEKLITSVPWLYDVMDNQTAEALAAEGNSGVFIFSSDGTQLYAGPIADETGLRKLLADIVGTATTPTSSDSLPPPNLAPLEMPETKFVERVKINPATDHYVPLQTSPMESEVPYYVKARVEGDKTLIESGEGKIYLGFHIDPLYQSAWNNLGEPLRYTLKAPQGVVAPSINSAPRVTEQATDTEPREFLLEARKLDPNKPLILQVSYSIYSALSKRTIEVQQQYFVYLSQDPFGGRVFGRQPNKAAQAKTDASNSSAYEKLLERFDFDRNGQLTKEETIGRLFSQFDQIDTNGNGTIEEDEYTVYLQNR